LGALPNFSVKACVEGYISGGAVAGFEGAVLGHVLFGNAVAVSSGLGVLGEVDPAELLEWGFERRKLLGVDGRRCGGGWIGESQAVAQRDEAGGARALNFDGEADEVGLGVGDVHTKQAHALAAPELKGQ